MDSEVVVLAFEREPLRQALEQHLTRSPGEPDLALGSRDCAVVTKGSPAAARYWAIWFEERLWRQRERPDRSQLIQNLYEHPEQVWPVYTQTIFGCFRWMHGGIYGSYGSTGDKPGCALAALTVFDPRCIADPSKVHSTFVLSKLFAGDPRDPEWVYAGPLQGETVCPKCGSNAIRRDLMLDICEDCGYETSFPTSILHQVELQPAPLSDPRCKDPEKPIFTKDGIPYLSEYGDEFELKVAAYPVDDCCMGDCHGSLPTADLNERLEGLDPKRWQVIADAEGDFVALVPTMLAGEVVARLNQVPRDEHQQYPHEVDPSHII